MNKRTSVVIKLFFPLAVIIGAFSYSGILGTVLLIVYLAFLIYSQRVSSYVFRGNISYSKGNLEQALQWFDKAYKTGKTQPQTAISYAYLLLKNGKVEESERILSEILKSKLSTNEVMLAKSNYALVLWKMGKLEDAVALLKEVYKDYKTSVIYGSLGYLLILKRDLDEALKFNLEAYEYNHTNVVILDNLGQTYYLVGKYDRAMELYEKLMSSNPAFPEAYYNYGLVLLAKNEKKKALESIKKSLDYNLTFLSTVTRKEIEKKIAEIESE